MKTDNLLDQPPFAHGAPQKRDLFLPAMQESLLHHYNSCGPFRAVCDSAGFSLDREFSVDDIPYLPVSIFKTVELISVPKEELSKNIKSSATSSGIPSSIWLDRRTIQRQTKALSAILADFFGQRRKVFIVLDSEETLMARNGQLSSRGGAIRGMLSMAKSFHCVTDNELRLDRGRLAEAIAAAGDDDICFFGFTWLIYKIVTENPDLRLSRPGSLVLHIGGWKKLAEAHVDKAAFNTLVAERLGTSAEMIRDVYGMTEQLGTVYVDCEAGNKHVPLYSDLLIRDTATLMPLGTKQPGFIQLLSPLPYSYPGISLLTDDIGEIIGEDDCPCGRKGKYFLFRERAKQAEIKGCGDTLR